MRPRYSASQNRADQSHELGPYLVAACAGSGSAWPAMHAQVRQIAAGVDFGLAAGASASRPLQACGTCPGTGQQHCDGLWHGISARSPGRFRMRASRPRLLLGWQVGHRRHNASAGRVQRGENQKAAHMRMAHQRGADARLGGRQVCHCPPLSCAACPCLQLVRSWHQAGHSHCFALLESGECLGASSCGDLSQVQSGRSQDLMRACSRLLVLAASHVHICRLGCQPAWLRPRRRPPPAHDLLMNSLKSPQLSLSWILHGAGGEPEVLAPIKASLTDAI